MLVFIFIKNFRFLFFLLNVGSRYPDRYHISTAKTNAQHPPKSNSHHQPAQNKWKISYSDQVLLQFFFRLFGRLLTADINNITIHTKGKKKQIITIHAIELLLHALSVCAQPVSQYTFASWWLFRRGIKIIRKERILTRAVNMFPF